MNEVTDSLVSWLRSGTKHRMVFREIALTGSWGSMGRLDVATLLTSKGYTINQLDGFEVKASRSDLLRDLNEGKWRKYLLDEAGGPGPLHRLFFAFPAGLAKPDEIPAECGVLTRTEAGGWRWSRRAPTLPAAPRTDTWIRLLWAAEFEARHATRAEDRLGRMERVARIERTAELASLLSERFKGALWEVESRESQVRADQDRVREATEAVEGLPDVLEAAGAVLGTVREAVAGRWRPGRSDARAAVMRVAEALKAELEEARRERVAVGS